MVSLDGCLRFKVGHIRIILNYGFVDTLGNSQRDPQKYQSRFQLARISSKRAIGGLQLQEHYHLLKKRTCHHVHVTQDRREEAFNLVYKTVLFQGI